MRKIVIFAAAILFILLLSIEAVYLASSSFLASESLKVEEIKNKIEKLDEENKLLESEKLSYSSLLVISSRAAEMGFVKPKEIISLSNNEAIALRRE